MNYKAVNYTWPEFDVGRDAALLVSPNKEIWLWDGSKHKLEQITTPYGTFWGKLIPYPGWGDHIEKYLLLISREGE